jgi:hypothetical protein
MTERFAYRFAVLGRYQAQLKGNESHVTVNMRAGRDEHLVHCGTLTMSEAEWSHFISALKRAMPDDVEVDDPQGLLSRPPH